ncbi:hypothetical protein [Methanoregula sp.]|uniref:hypothetical protein n=1 Tax=Methanoregula sp. TaxID=2052170 RepID=UPI003566380E
MADFVTKRVVTSGICEPAHPIVNVSTINPNVLPVNSDNLSACAAVACFMSRTTAQFACGCNGEMTESNS